MSDSMFHLWTVLLYFVHLLLSLSFHESAHAWTAWRLGDPTARYQGRITLNPLPHIDPIGTVLLPLISLIAGGIVIGWAKPTPVDARYFRHPRRGQMLTALAGPVSNLLLATFFALVYHFLRLTFTDGLRLGLVAELVLAICLVGVQLNIALALFNLLPLFPLDGSWVAEGLLPRRWLVYWYQAKPFMPFMLMALFLIPGFFGTLLVPVLRLLMNLLGVGDAWA